MSNPASRPPGSGPEWEELLQQLRQQPRAQPQPFFYARVQARLIAQAQPRNWALPGWARRPAYAALLGTLLLLVSGDGVALRSPVAPSPYHGPPAPLPPR